MEMRKFTQKTNSYYQRFIKRTMDLFACLILLTLMWPILLIIYITVRYSIGSPVIYKQKRPGLNGKPFTIFKFRTMSNAKDEDGNLLPDELRLTKIGMLIRSLSLDELPEIFNVLKGELSLVGPRPLMMQYLEVYTPEQARRHEVMPGITGWAQVNGRNSLSWEQKFDLDVWYVDHQSFFLDIRILIMTVWKVLTREGISEEGYATASWFNGSNQKETKKQNY